jgi:hypothetical protein
MNGLTGGFWGNRRSGVLGKRIVASDTRRGGLGQAGWTNRSPVTILDDYASAGAATARRRREFAYCTQVDAGFIGWFRGPLRSG